MKNRILWHTVFSFAIPLCAGVLIGIWADMGAQGLHLCDFCCVFQVVALLCISQALLQSELDSTRKELKNKVRTSISIEVIRSYADLEGSKYGLTSRECEIIQLLMSGCTASRIARDLCVAESTVRTHIQSIYRKMGVHNKQEMVDRVGSELPS